MVYINAVLIGLVSKYVPDPCLMKTLKADSVILNWYDDDFEHKFSTQVAKVPIQIEQ